MTPIVIDRHESCQYDRTQPWTGAMVAVCDCGWRSNDCRDLRGANEEWLAHRRESPTVGEQFQVVTEATDSRNKRELRHVWLVEAESADEAAEEARMAHAPRVGWRGVDVKSVEKVA